MQRNGRVELQEVQLARIVVHTPGRGDRKVQGSATGLSITGDPAGLEPATKEFRVTKC
jgi:hypothetical protein